MRVPCSASLDRPSRPSFLKALPVIVPLVLCLSLVSSSTAEEVPLAALVPLRELPPAQSPGNDERDPALRQSYAHHRADAVEARHLGRTLAALGRKTKNPLPLLAAAQLFEQAPSTRPLAAIDPVKELARRAKAGSGPQAGPGAAGAAAPHGGERSSSLPGSLAGSLPGSLTGSLTGPASVQDNPTPADLLAEARSFMQRGALRRELLSLADLIAKSEIIVRGASLGPQQLCEGISPGVRVTYGIFYDGGERAVLAISGAGPESLHVTVVDEDDHLISRTTDRSLITWYPRKQGTFWVELDNPTQQRIRFCLETN